jgi:hypothetical protein
LRKMKVATKIVISPRPGLALEQGTTYNRGFLHSYCSDLKTPLCDRRA